MTIEEMKRAKKDLEHDIELILVAFEVLTGTRITGIDAKDNAIPTYTEGQRDPVMVGSGKTVTVHVAL